MNVLNMSVEFQICTINNKRDNPDQKKKVKTLVLNLRML